jgi:hypothetical protein
MPIIKLQTKYDNTGIVIYKLVYGGLFVSVTIELKNEDADKIKASLLISDLTKLTECSKNIKLIKDLLKGQGYMKEYSLSCPQPEILHNYRFPYRKVEEESKQ